MSAKAAPPSIDDSDHDDATSCCPICLSADIADPIWATIDCRHTFCYKCLSAWFREKLSCPVCRIITGPYDASSPSVSTQSNFSYSLVMIGLESFDSTMQDWSIMSRWSHGDGYGGRP